jgi:hypothetical protein
MRGILLSGVLCLAACGGSTEATSPEDAGIDGSIGDTAVRDGALDSAPDSSSGDAATDVPTDVPSADTASTDTLPSADAKPDAPRGDSGGGPCGAGGTCGTLLKCCSGACIYDQNDPLNCGGCGIECTGATSMCEAGRCVAPTCAPACADGKICCDINGPGPTTGPKCVDGPTCPIGCPLCL